MHVDILEKVIHGMFNDGFSASERRTEFAEYLVFELQQKIEYLESRIQKLESRLESEDDIKIGGTD